MKLECKHSGVLDSRSICFLLQEEGISVPMPLLSHHCTISPVENSNQKIPNFYIK